MIESGPLWRQIVSRVRRAGLVGKHGCSSAGGAAWAYPASSTGEHLFTLASIDGGRTRHTQREVFTGVLVPLLARSIDDGAMKGFEAMNLALKEREKRNVTSL